MSDNGDEGLELTMPFVSVTSNGGPHDDESYACGFEMGSLDARLRVAAFLGTKPEREVIHTSNVEQTDLIAMKHGFKTSFYENTYSEHYDPNWTDVTFR